MMRPVRIIMMITGAWLILCALANPVSYFGEWAPTSTTSLSITGSAIIRKDEVLFDGKHRMFISNRRQRQAVDESSGPVVVDIFDIVKPNVIVGLQGTKIKNKSDDTIVLRLIEPNTLMIYVCEKSQMPQSDMKIGYSPIGCNASYVYERKRNQPS